MKKRRKRAVIVLASAATLLAIAGTAWSLSAVSQHDCELPDVGIQVWSEQVEQEVATSFLASGLPFAATVQETLNNQFHERVSSLNQVSKQICVEQDQPYYELRLACLDSSVQELAALAEIFRKADETIVENAVQAFVATSSPWDCLASSRLTLAEPAADQVHADRLRAALVKATAHKRSGKYKTAITEASKIANQADESERNILASALFIEGSSLVMQGDSNEGEQLLLRALEVADESRNDYLRAQVLVELTYVVGFEQWRGHEGLRWGHLAQSALKRIGGDLPMSFRLAIGLSGSHYVIGNEEESLRIGEETLNQARDLYGEDHVVTAFLLSSTGGDYANIGEPEEGLAYHTLAIAIASVLLGERHPDVAMYRNNYGASLAGLDRSAEAKQEFDAAIEIWKATESNSKQSLALNNLGVMALNAGELDEALSHIQEAAQKEVDTLGSDHLRTGGTLVVLAYVHIARGETELAYETFEKARQVWEGADNNTLKLAEIRFQIAKLDWDSHHDSVAIREARAAFASLASIQSSSSSSEYLRSELEGEINEWLLEREH